MGDHFCLFQNTVFEINSGVLVRIFDSQRVTKNANWVLIRIKILHHFFVLMPYGDTPFGFFCACVLGWIARIYLYFGKTENLKSPHSEGLKSVKIPQILRLAILGNTGIYQVVSALFAAYFLKNLSFFLFLQWVQRRILFCEPSSFEYFLWQSKSDKTIRDFCFQHRCTPENRYCGVTDCYLMIDSKKTAIFAEMFFVFSNQFF